MGEIKAEIRSLAEEVAITFESSVGIKTQNQQLPSSITIYQTGRVLLFTCHTNNNDSRATILQSSFDNMISSLPNKYMHKLLQKLHLAYASMILSYATSASTTCPTLSAIHSMIGKSSHASSAISEQDIIEGTESLCGIYLSSQHCCMLNTSDDGSRTELELIFISLSWVYDYITSNEKKSSYDDESSASIQTLILKTLSTLLIHGCGLTVGKSFEEDQDEQISSIMTVIQNIQSALGEYNCALGDMLVNSVDEMKEDEQFEKALCSKFEASDMSQPPQLQYLLAMLRAAAKSNDKKPSSGTIDNSVANSQQTETLSKPETQQTMTDIQIEHIKSILPVLGEGYIEEALKCYNHDVERTLEALLQVSEGGQDSSIHPRLLTTPNNLPRKMKESKDQYSANVNLHRGNTAKDDGKEHLQVQKKHIQHAENQAEEEAFLIDSVSRSLGGLRVAEDEEDDELISGMKDEYNDDYDDQYDGIGDGGLGDMDEGLYDVDIHNVHQKYDRGGAKNEQQMWRKYNNLIKDVDSESQFWEDNRNTNRTGSNQTDGNKNFGPDKGRGGRAIGPDGKYLPIKRGGKKGRGQPTNNNNNQGRGGAGRGRGGGRGGGDSKPNKDGDDMSKIQKRRKNDNKAKVANHHRKDRANKKAGGGMVM